MTHRRTSLFVSGVCDYSNLLYKVNQQSHHPVISVGSLLLLVLWFVLLLSASSAEDQISSFSFSLDFTIASLIASCFSSTRIKTAASHLPESRQRLGHSSCVGSQNGGHWDPRTLLPELYLLFQGSTEVNSEDPLTALCCTVY